MRPTVLLLALLPLAAAAPAEDRQRVPAGQLVAAARDALQAKAAAAHLDAKLASVGHVDDLLLQDPAAFELRADVQDAWLRPRIGVPVQVYVGDRRVSTVMAWFAVSVPMRACVYGAGYARGTPAAGVRTRTGEVDLARTHGAWMPSIADAAGLRLRRAVLAGDPVLPDDFEPVPDVRAQQSVRVDSSSGPIRISTSGRALSDGRIGQVIEVLPADATQPVRARVVSNQVVSIEN